MSIEHAIRDSIERAADVVGAVWPVHSFVTANPLSGFEDRPFHEAVRDGADRFAGQGYPDADTIRRAWESGRIDPDVLAETATSHGVEADPETLLERLNDGDDPSEADSASPVDDVLTKWLSTFLDQGVATWSMPDRDDGFWAAWRAVAPHDDEIPAIGSADDLPSDPIEAIEAALSGQPEGRWEDVFEQHLAALPGWTGFIKRRSDEENDWQDAHPITLVEYLAVRLTLVDTMDEPIYREQSTAEQSETPPAAVVLEAWEASYREELVDAVTAEAETLSGDDSRPAAQLVFCIDTRSEVFRRHLEAAGPYETHGYAGFFGVPMRYEGYDDDVAVDACPPIVEPEHRITDRPEGAADGEQATYDRRSGLRDASASLLKSLRSNAATVFSFVESTGVAYGLGLTARTLLPGRVSRVRDTADESVPDHHEFCEPTVDYNPDAVTPLREGLTLEEKVAYAETAFSLMGWEQFGRLVVFTGHASETANNPFDSSLDCGACAGNPGGPNARVLASICNDDAVRDALADRGHEIPDDTVFLAAEHNTTTDEVTLFDSDVPASHEEDVSQLREDLAVARAGAAAERTDAMADEADDPVDAVERRAADWAETRPEWGLAGNASFVVGPRDLTADLDLDGRAFLHSYDWSTDADGEALEDILTGPMVVTQWINAQYYFATVDTAAFGSGSKITQNPVGNVGVYQGNGGDLMTGLPLQSLYAADDVPYHQPIRLSTVVHAPVDTVTEILASNDEIRELLDNGWLSVTVVDPEQDNRAFHYDGDLEWDPHAAERPESTPAAVEMPAADD
ncbi:DUF2309 domain-containing protein [Haloarculaceae archaeon H-GB2-1]|nr:DUF2309 domain-containing protein [Haloarculaceae archaeon H-GB1-1]MEA5408863.1 DUF2309 domain-containing protein [Haloarculaceae archaeon H-GB2-1]